MKSKKYQLNNEDVKKQLRACIVWLAPLMILYFAQLSGAIADKKVLGWADFVPNEMTVGGIQLYVINQAYGIFNKFVAGK